ncbi:MAG: glycosyltransferase, partial [Acidobacteriaceae bacterium]|nr:glycosyltransferase [Acidobacteriaceae bacterium]
MTHDTRFTLRFQSHSAFVRAAVIYDFIPLEWPGYLPTVTSRIDYVAKMARLRRFDLFLPISEYSAWRLSELIGIPRERISVTGASVRRSLYQLRDSREIVSSISAQKDPYFLIVTASDPRKNSGVAVKAVRRLNQLYSKRILLRVIGHYDEDFKRQLLRLAGHAEHEGFLEFFPNISDEELVSMYAGAIATIAPSHIEGFSLPVVESSVCGCPVIASTCAAHLELIEPIEALFPSNDSIGLSEKLDAVLNEPSLRASLLASQAKLAERFHEDEVGRRFWKAIEIAVENRRDGASVAAPRKPRFAFLSPFPPDQSGVARYTAMTMQAGSNLFESSLYTDSPRPLGFAGSFLDAGRVSLAPVVGGGYDGVISVLGNSKFHTSIFEVFERYGGPCILHDARLIEIYLNRLRQQEFLNLAGKFLNRPVGIEEA